ncbi:MAG: nucleotidyltransferase [Bryobacteraceae bacterium]|nr:nucleotidyltransferase [Bryobacteraceae bacterium]
MKSLSSNGVRYLLIGGYAVNLYGYVRSTGGLDVWIANDPENAAKVAGAVRGFGFKDASAEMFQDSGAIVRMGLPPVRIEIMTGIYGVEFDACYERRQTMEISGLAVPVIDLDDLKRNKRAAGRMKDLADLEEL